MFPAPHYTMNLRGKLVDLQRPWVMGILNVTPDSFYADSRTPMAEPERIAQRVRQMLAEGADVIDVGAYSSRPGADDISPMEEMRRLEVALTAVREVFPEVYVSVDTFRSEVAHQCVEHFGVDMINDISGGLARSSHAQGGGATRCALHHHAHEGESRNDADVSRISRRLGRSLGVFGASATAIFRCWW